MSKLTNKKSCLILQAMGGPDKNDDIPEFLYNIFSDRSIIRLPGSPLLQKPLAKLISKLRSDKVKAHYNLIGGGSPLLKWTQAQLEHLEFTLSPMISGFKTYIGMRYFKPFTETTIEKAIAEGFDKIYFLPLYPQYCKATTGSSFEVARNTLKKHPKIEAVFINDFHDFKSYTDLLKKYIDDNIKADEHLLFSAHSIPQKFVDEGDPYVEQTKKTAQLVAGSRDYTLSFQSRTGPVTWVGPDTVEKVKELTLSGKKLFIVPISFVCDHIETMYELDIELKETIGEPFNNQIRRMPMFNDDPEFGKALSELFLEYYNNGK